MTITDAGSAHTRVLVIDRSPTVTTMICGLLHRWGYQARSALNRREGDDAVACDMLIADPDMIDERLAGLRTQVPWLALVSGAGALNSSDASGWVVKPIEPDALHAAVRRCLDQHPASPPEGGIDIDAIIAAWGSVHDDKFRRVVNLFLVEMVQHLDTIAQALEAVDRSTLLLASHSIVGAAANVGGRAMAGAARDLEDAAMHAEAEPLRRLLERLRSICDRDLPVLRGFVNAGKN
jgi:HPt (histidine-containing phosphotransfer) domain-containing protein/CheY-like chemotaxis protein